MLMIQSFGCSFRRAAESIIAISSALPREELDDEEGRNAYRAIGVLVKQVRYIPYSEVKYHFPEQASTAPAPRQFHWSTYTEPRSGRSFLLAIIIQSLRFLQII
jgi:hypothetical protein